MNTPPRSPDHDQLTSKLDALASAMSSTSSSRRALFGQISTAALAMMFAGSFAPEASAAPRTGPAPNDDGAPGIITVPLGKSLVTLQQVEADLILFEIFIGKQLIHSAMHAGTITPELIRQTRLLVKFAKNLQPEHVIAFNELLEDFGLGELAIPLGTSDQVTGGFVFILVIFILLVIIGAGIG